MQYLVKLLSIDRFHGLSSLYLIYNLQDLLVLVENVISERIKPLKNDRIKESKNGAFTSSGVGDKGCRISHPLTAIITEKHSKTA